MFKTVAAVKAEGFAAAGLEHPFGDFGEYLTSDVEVKGPDVGIKFQHP